HAMPLVAGQLIFRNAGTAAAPDSPALAPAAARFLSLPLDAGAFARTGVRVGCHATPDATICESSGISIYQEIVVRGLERLVSAGVYSTQAIEAEQQRMRGLFTARRQQDSELVRQVQAALFGPEHPYARAAAVTPDALDRVHLDVLDAFRHDHYT